MKWSEVPSGGGYSRIVGMDPYADWALGPGWRDFTRGSDAALIPFIIAPLDERSLQSFIQAMSAGTDGEASSARFETRILSFYDEIEVGDYIAGFASQSFFDLLAEPRDDALAALRDAKKQIRLGLPLAEMSLPRSTDRRQWPNLASPPPNGGCSADGVVIGIIDDGIAFAHERFRDAAGGTRVQYFWQQDGRYDELHSTVPFGREIWKGSSQERRGIDALLERHETAGLVNEEALYREAGLIDFRDPGHKAAAWRLAHGTHVLDLAAGYARHEAPETRPIIAVQLPVSATADTSGSSLEFYVKVAVDYIVHRAGLLGAAGGGAPPVAINFSYGMFAGPHDGTSALEQAFDNAIENRKEPLRMILPAGNGHLSRCYAEIDFSGHPTVTLPWRVQPGDLTGNQMEIWLPNDGAGRRKTGESRASLRLETPSGLLSASLSEDHGAAIQLLDDDGAVVAEARYAFQAAPTDRGMFLVSVQPTQRFRPEDNDPTAPSGLWKVHITQERLAKGEKLQAWIQRDDVLYGYPRRARQSYFDAACYTRFDHVTGRMVEDDHEDDGAVPPCHVKRRSLLNAIATGCSSVVVGGAYRKELVAASYSAGGPTTTRCERADPREGPDVLSVSDDSRVHSGVLAAGSRSGSTVALSGTSVATPQVTRLVAEQLAGPAKSGTRRSIRDAAIAEEMIKGWRPPLPRRVRAGAGRIVGDSSRLPRIDPDI